MKCIVKWVGNLLISLIFLILFWLLNFIYIHETSIDKVLSKNQQSYLFNDIKNTEKLPSSFYETIEKYYPNYFETTIWEWAVKRSLNMENYREVCPCKEIYLPFVPGDISSLRRKKVVENPSLVISLELEERYTSKKCYDYLMNSTSFGDSTRGVSEAALRFYNKELIDLTEKEILALDIIKLSPSLYNPRRHPSKLENRVNAVLKKYEDLNN